MKNFGKIICGMAVALAFAAAQASADTLSWDVAGHGTPFDTTLTGVITSTGITPTPALSRVGLAGITAGNSFAQNNWNNTALFGVGNNYITFTLTATSALTLDSLQFAMNGSATAPNSGRWGYEINGLGGFTTFNFTLPAALPVSLNTWTIGGTPVSSGDTVEFRFWAWGTTRIDLGTAIASSSGSVRVGNITGNDLVLNYTVVPEPSTIVLIGFGLAGLLAFARRRHA